MLNEFLVQMRPYFDDDERQALLNYDFENGFLTEYKKTFEFEQKLADFLKATSAVAVNNGTVALTIAAMALDIKPDDEVIIPNFTMIATPNSIRILGAKPVFADVEIDTWCISRDEIFNKINSRTKAVVLVSANGRTPTYDVDRLREDLNNLGIYIIEDAAQALGSFYSDGEHVGLKGNIATLSFSAPKIISTGQGGLVFSRNSDLLDKVRKIKDFGRESGGNDIHDMFGVNFKFTELQAIIGLSQMAKLENRLQIRKNQNKLYEKYFSENIQMPVNNYQTTTPWFSEILIDNRDELAEILRLNNIGTRNVYPEINKQKIYFEKVSHEHSNKISAKGLWLPSHMGVSEEHIEKICEIINHNC